jgi:polyferredoxin
MNNEIFEYCFMGLLILFLIMTGRLFCGKICPLGYAQDIIYKIPFITKIKTFKLDKYLRLIKYFILLINYIIMPILAFSGINNIVQNGDRTYSPIIMILTFSVVIIISIIVSRPICKYFCPVGVLAGLFNKISFYKYKTFNDKCIKCEICSKKCKMNIIPYENKNSLECIRCGKCKKICPKNAIIAGFNIKKIEYAGK